jgi:pantoate--beta-alanine ligase
MRIIRAPEKISRVLKKIKLEKKSVGFVPTMGALHAGHLSLILQARKENDFVVVSIFVNPAQFGPREDYRQYPRPIKKDIAFLRRAGVDFIFNPQAKDMYPEGSATYVSVEGLSRLLCGRIRPGHFRGVATVVAKLFNIIGPDTAYFGQKDAQQAIIIKRMAGDLNMPVKIKVMPIVRERDGLALSSRNVYLDKQERKDALVLSQALNLAKNLIKGGAEDSDKIVREMKKLIRRKKIARIDYAAVVDLKSLKPLKKISDHCLIALAVWIGKTRLIDNICLKN